MNLPNEVIKLRRELDLLKKTQVVISDTQPREASPRTIWRDGEEVKVQDGTGAWINIAGGGAILDFSTSVVFSSTGYQNVTWSAGAMNVGKDTGSVISSIGAGSVTITANTFFYWSPSIPTAIQTTTTPNTAILDGGIIVAVGIPNSDPTGAKAAIKTFGNNQNDLITADQIVANTITANKLSSALVYAGYLQLSTAGHIRSGKVTYADTLTGFWLGNDSGTPKFRIGTSSTYMDWNGSAFSLAGGTITGATIQTASSGARTVMDSNGVSGKDSSGVTRVQLANAATPSLAFFNSSSSLIASLLTNTYSPSYGGSINILQSTGAFVAGGVLACTSHLDVLGTGYFGRLKLPVGSNLY